jgi:ATP-dependent DNA helicase PIF1
MSILFDSLSADQVYALEKFKHVENLFITGPGGTGKTRLIHHLVQHCRVEQKEVQVCAMTGCAAILLGNGAKTLHSWSGMRLGRGTKAQIVAAIRSNPRAVKNWKMVKVLILDEVSMLSKKLFEAIEEAARTIRRNPARFGGIQVIFTGDFFQLPPVGNAIEPDTASFCFESPIWTSVFQIRNHVELRTIFRQTDPIYKEILMEIRRGTISEANAEILKKYVGREKPTDCVPTKLFAVKSKADFVNKAMYDKIEEKEYSMEYIPKTTMKTYTESGKEISKELLDKCSHMTSSETQFEIESLITNTGYAPTLHLKKGAVVMCTVNYDMDRGICNGMQGVVVDIIEYSSTRTCAPVVRFINGITITMEIHYRQSEEYPCIAVGQYPLCLAWALTIHKIQGATLKIAEMDIGKSIFEYGQTYVALSRIESLEGLYLSAFHPQKIKANERVVEFYENIAKSHASEEEDISVDSDELVEEEPVLSPRKENIFQEFAYKPSLTESTTRKIIL